MEENTPKKLSSDIDDELTEIMKGVKTNIFVVGAGGAGNNTISRLNEMGIEGATTIAVNTDAQDLFYSQSAKKILLGRQTSKGLGAGGDPTVGEECAEESEDEIRDELEGSDMVFVTCGMGGGTGTGAAPVVAKIAKDMGILTVGVVTKPFRFEARTRMVNAMGGITKIKDNVDTLIVIPNDKLLEIVDRRTTMPDALKKADEVLQQAVQGITDLINVPAIINLDFADVQTVMKDKGIAHIGIGSGKGDDKASEAVKMAVESPLLETTIEGATGILLNVKGGMDLPIDEVDEAAALVKEVVDPSCNIIFGATIDSDLHEEVEITIIATGFDLEDEKYIDEKGAFDISGTAILWCIIGAVSTSVVIFVFSNNFVSVDSVRLCPAPLTLVY